MEEAPKKSVSTKAILRWALPLVALLFIVCCRYVPSLAEGYAQTVYPCVSAVLSAFAALFPFSLEEVLVVAVILWLIVFPLRARRKGRTWKQIAAREVEVLTWIYIWFYMGWGLNYFRYNIYTRMQRQPLPYEEQQFLNFLHSYTDSLNAAYLPQQDLPSGVLEAEVKSFYTRTAEQGKLTKPRDWQRPKFFTLTPVYSSVGVLGSMGPFFAEAQLNADLLPIQLPFTYAHEFSHLLGVSNEAEANYWAYRACTESASPILRYSGYLGLFPYVASNAMRLLSESQYREWAQTVRREVWEDYRTERTHWQQKYSTLIGEAQDFIYNLFLQGNQIPSGKKNYAEVIGLLLSLEVKNPQSDNHQPL